MYKAIEYFTDLQDNGYEYRIGDVYPRKGYEPSAERIAELSGKDNIRGRAVIEAEKKAETDTADDEKPKKRNKK